MTPSKMNFIIFTVILSTMGFIGIILTLLTQPQESYDPITTISQMPLGLFIIVFATSLTILTFLIFHDH